MIKTGDLVKFRNLDPSWGEIALITKITEAEGVIQGMIILITSTGVRGTIPWTRRNTYIEEVINEGR